MPFVWQRKEKDGSEDNGMEDDGLGDLTGEDGSLNNLSTNMAIDPSPSTGSGQVQGSQTAHILRGIAVTPFNPNPRTPRAIELV